MAASGLTCQGNNGHACLFSAAGGKHQHTYGSKWQNTYGHKVWPQTSNHLWAQMSKYLRAQMSTYLWAKAVAPGPMALGDGPMGPMPGPSLSLDSITNHHNSYLL